MSDLPDLETARGEARSTCGQMIKDGGITSLWNGGEWKMWFTDEANKTLFSVTFSAVVTCSTAIEKA